VYQKEIDENTSGLHRKLNYHILWSIGPRQLRGDILNNEECSIFIIDYCEKGFYIDREELQSRKDIKFYENKVMNIENMDEIEKEYFYVIEIPMRLGINVD
jgi:hypothetical protein